MVFFHLLFGKFSLLFETAAPLSGSLVAHLFLLHGYLHELGGALLLQLVRLQLDLLGHNAPVKLQMSLWQMLVKVLSLMPILQFDEAVAENEPEDDCGDQDPSLNRDGWLLLCFLGKY